MRGAIKSALDRWASRCSRPLSTAELVIPAVVFAPHPDDETLGCGGLIALKKRLGVAVKVVFMTDGQHSHNRFLDEDDLAVRRRQEAYKACGVLGVRNEDVHFLGYPDQYLHEHAADAQQQVEAILAHTPDCQVFVPYRLDKISDHLATRDIVWAAVAACGSAREQTIQVFGYPVWFWHHWPQSSVAVERRARLPQLALATVRAWAARLSDLRSHVEIGMVLAQKQQALAQHRTQMERPDAHPDWPILSDVGSGQWLASFFGDREYFHREANNHRTV